MRRPLPVEVVPFGWQATMRRLAPLAGRARLRLSQGQPFVTDNGNLIIDLAMGKITDPSALERRLKSLPGVVEVGLFVGMTDLVVVGSDAGSRTIERP